MRAYILIAPLLLSASSVAGEAAPAPVQGIALYSYGYNPEPIVLSAGKAVTLNFLNRATKGHDFTAKKFFSSSRIISGNVADGEIDLGPGQSASVTLVPAAGRYKVHCGHPFHKMMGMSGDIVVR